MIGSILSLALALVPHATRNVDAPQPALVIVNARIAGVPEADAISVRDGRIVAVGKKAAVEQAAGPGAQHLDAGRGVVLPGLHDAHVHLLGGGSSLARVDLSPHKTLENTLRAVKMYADSHPSEPWILARGWQYGIVAAGSFPTSASLDRDVSAERPIFLRSYDGHAAWANGKALKLAGITRDTKNPDDGTIIRDSDGAPTGALLEGAMDLVSRILPESSRAEKKAALAAAIDHCARLGLTSIDAIESDEDVWELATELEAEGRLPIRLRIGFPIDGDLTRYEGMRARETAHVHFGILKGFVDGVIESKTAYMLAPYTGEPEARGFPLIPPAKLHALVENAHARGFQVALHAIGDAGVRLSLDAFEAAATKHPKRHVRHRIEHIETIDSADVARFKKLDVVASMQPYHANPFGPDPDAGVWSQNLGPERLTRAFAWRLLKDAGAPLAFGSDWPVFTANPLHAMAVGTTRRDENGEPKAGWGANQALSFDELLHGYTVERGGAEGPATEVGRIAANQRADLVILSSDADPARPSTLWRAAVRRVLVDGKVVVDQQKDTKKRARP